MLEIRFTIVVTLYTMLLTLILILRAKIISNEMVDNVVNDVTLMNEFARTYIHEISYR